MTTEDIRAWFDHPAWRTELEAETLPTYLRAERWFSGKERWIEGIRVHDWLLLDASAPEGGVVFAIVDVQFARGPAATYCLPLRISQAGSCSRDDGPLLVSTAIALQAMIAGRQVHQTDRGRVRGFATKAYVPPLGGVPAPALLTGVEQSNTSLRFGEHWMLKLVRRLEPGPNPDQEIGRFLLERTSFRRTPALAGWVEYQRAGQEPTTLAMLNEYVENEGNAWGRALDALTKLVETPPGTPDRAHLALVAASSFGKQIGLRTAELHRALVSAHDDPAFRTEPFTEEDLRIVQSRIHEHLGEVLPAVERLAGAPKSAHREPAAALLAQREELIAMARPPQLSRPAIRMRCHGDYHLGQLLWADGDCWVIDFEGEPTRPLEERRAKHSPLKDVAGMLRSFDYAAQTSYLDQQEDSPQEQPAVRRVRELWRKTVTEAFLSSYRTAAKGSAALPIEPDLSALLAYLRFDKAIYELYYELNNRPQWVGIPLAGILSLLQPTSERRALGPP